MNLHQSNQLLYTSIGKLVKVRGNLGQFKAISLTNSPEFYLNLESIYLQHEVQKQITQFKIHEFRFVNNYFIIQFTDIDTYEKAEKWISAFLLVEDNQLKPLEENEYFIHSLIDAEVFDKKGQSYGIVKHYFENSAHGICEIWNHGQIFLLPIVEEFVFSIDHKEKKIVADVEPFIDL